MSKYIVKKMTGAQLKPGMIHNGREIAKVRQGVGSGKIWTYLTYATANENGSKDGRVRRNTVKVDVQVPVS